MHLDLSWHALGALAQVILIDVTLAGDNAVVIGMAVRGLPPARQRLAILLGTLTAAIMRIGLALVAARLLAVIGLTLAGGLLLAWVCWKMYQELRRPPEEAATAASTSLRGAVIRLILADLSMSLDNVLAVAGAAMGHPYILIIGLAVAVLMMGAAAAVIARLLDRHRWIAWLGLAVVAFVALRLIYRGGMEVWVHV
ncbi:YjbE family putative metal transport protein [Acidomonas methanolica]|uniref:Integral membrane protein TerC n=1 Tax=Acidomonas methanolica NBRC 104435 TaxID=1231351 RepID=A0A023D0N9_ACIMT|nr:YjbE family putative metal transport protein [Acidomonas methanolica]TCS32328.1 YjbE family integral membrane protein [Acidomonas methanolica]GAJ27703.1 integral membrane protein TerC [Acidomonas methanolica NBRC 104435]GBQ53106.1 integral membrane protein TerC [Acidomonas methanolica]GEK97765.1 membrane protein [Acidomonas methanolica NBRC 104435]